MNKQIHQSQTQRYSRHRLPQRGNCFSRHHAAQWQVSFSKKHYLVPFNPAIPFVFFTGDPLGANPCFHLDELRSITMSAAFPLTEAHGLLDLANASNLFLNSVHTHFFGPLSQPIPGRRYDSWWVWQIVVLWRFWVLRSWHLLVVIVVTLRLKQATADR